MVGTEISSNPKPHDLVNAMSSSNHPSTPVRTRPASYQAAVTADCRQDGGGVGSHVHDTAARLWA